MWETQTIMITSFCILEDNSASQTQLVFHVSLRGLHWLTWVKSIVSFMKPPFYPFPKQALVFKCLQYKSLEKIEGKGEIAGNVQFLLFPQCFLLVWRTECHFHQTQHCHLQTLSVWKGLKFVIWERVKENGAVLHLE